MIRHESQRGYFAYELHQHMEIDPDIWVITPDLGYGMLDGIQEDFPERFINTGAAEQAAMGVAVGLAMEGKKPFIYSITPFLLYRPFETIRNYIHHEGWPVRLIGSGRDDDYAHDGFSHHAFEDRAIMKVLDGIKCAWPDYKEEIPGLVNLMVEQDRPWYLNLKR